MTVLINTLNSFFMFIDSIVYWLISIAYRVFLLVSKASFYNSDNQKIQELSNRIYVILGVAMLFILAYNIILLIMNPDKFGSNDDKSIQGILKNLVISVVIITFLPTIFSWMSVLQYNILDSQVIEKVILGYNVDEGDKSAKIDTVTMGNKISTLIFSTFYHPIDDNGNVLTYSDCKSPDLASDAKKICDNYVKAYEEAESTGSFSGFKDKALMNELTTGISNSVANMQYISLISTVIGVVCLLMFISYAVDVGIRVVKLTFLQIIAPVPVILRITKPNGGIFSKWLNMLIETYTSLFMRLVTIYFSVFTVNLIANGFMDVNGGIFGNASESNRLIILFGYLFVIVGVLLFAKEAPELIKSFTGGKGGGGFGLKDIKKKFTDAGNVAKSVPIAGSAIKGAEKGISKTYGAATGALGAASTALQNKKRGASVTDALKQGAWNGFKAGGRQFGAQRGKAFTDIYGYGKKQGILGGVSLEDKLNDKYGKLMNKNLKENAKKANEQYLENNLGDQIPKDNAGIIEVTDKFYDANKNFANTSTSYKEARDYVESEARKANVQLTADERNARINERLAQMAQTTTNENEKRSINSYLKRDSVIKSFEQSTMSGSAVAEQKLKDLAAETTRANVNAQIERNGVNNVITDATAKANISASVQTKYTNAGGKIENLGLGDAKLKEIGDRATAEISNLIKANGGNISNITLPATLAAQVQTKISDKVNAKISAAGDATNISLKGGDSAIRATLDAKKVQFEMDAKTKVDMNRVDAIGKLTASEEQAIRDQYTNGVITLSPTDIDKKVQEAANKKKQDAYNSEVERIAKESYDSEYKSMYKAEVEKELASDFKDDATKEVLHEAYSAKIAKEELYKKEVSDYLYNEQYSAVEKSLREKEAQDMKEQYEDYATGLADGTYTREESGKKDKAFDQTFKDNEPIIKDGVKTKSAEDLAFDRIKKMLKDSDEKKNK